MGLAGTPALADTISFDDLDHGEIVSTQLDGVTITALNPNRKFDLAVAFDSSLTGTSDEDLESASGPGDQLWSGGNLVDEDLGKMLILQENDTGCEDGVSDCLDPDDEGSRAAGTLTIVFATPVSSFGFDLIDVESTVAENGSITFSGPGGTTGPISFMSFLAGYTLGDNTANRVTPFQASELPKIDSIARVDILLGGSGAIDNLEFVPVKVPEPGTLALLASTAALWVQRRRSA